MFSQAKVQALLHRRHFHDMINGAREEELRKLHVEHGKEQREHRFDVESMTEQQKKMQTALLVKQRELQNKVADLQAAEKNLRAAHLAEQKKKTGTTSS